MNTVCSEINLDAIPFENLWILDNLGIQSCELEESDDFVSQNFWSIIQFEDIWFILR